MRRPIAILLTLLVSGACAEDPPASTPGRPDSVRVYARNLTLYPGPENAVRIAIDPAEPVAEMIATYRPDTARVHVCPLPSADAALPPLESCRRDFRSGVRDVVRGTALRALALLLEGTAEVPLDLFLEYGERTRALAARIPRVVVRGGPGCLDNACNPFVEVQPVRGGRLTATASWGGGEPASLVVLEGRVLARAQSGSGVPYREAARARGPSPLSVEANLSAPGEYALALQTANDASAAAIVLESVRLDAAWP